MATVFYAVKRYIDAYSGSPASHDWLSVWLPETEEWEAKKETGAAILLPKTLATEARDSWRKRNANNKRVSRIVLVKVTRYTAAETRLRSEARGEVAALEQVLHAFSALQRRNAAFVYETAMKMLEGARRRAGVKAVGTARAYERDPDRRWR